MMKDSPWIRTLCFSLVILMSVATIQGDEFQSPTKHFLMIVPLDEIKYNLKGKNVGLEYRELFDKAIEEEKIGFMGYHGAGQDFLIFQEIIRLTVEEIIGIEIRKDFHFIGIPYKKNRPFNSLEELFQVFVQDVYLLPSLLQNTFPLNFCLYSNHNTLGLNSVVNFSKNISENPLGNQRELKHFFGELGMDPTIVEVLYEMSYQRLDNQAGLLLQFFDNSPVPYTFGDTVSYPSYPNGFVTDNRSICEYFLDPSRSEFPKELRLVLSMEGFLNPTSPITVKRYTKMKPSTLKAWEQDLRLLIRSSNFDLSSRDLVRESLLQAWKN